MDLGSNYMNSPRKQGGAPPFTTLNNHMDRLSMRYIVRTRLHDRSQSQKFGGAN